MSTKKTDIKAEVVEMMMEKMNQTGLLPWSSMLLNRVWMPINGESKKDYKGINAVLLSVVAGSKSNVFYTYKQAQAAGGNVRKGEHGFPIVAYKPWNYTKHRAPEEDDPDTDDIGGFLKKYVVFSAEQCDGIKAPVREYKSRENVEHYEQAEDIVKKYAEASGLKIEIVSSTKLQSACYIPATHTVKIAPIAEYKTSGEWVHTLLHEVVHSTADAMGRDIKGHAFGSYNYSKEEIVAEFGAAMLSIMLGIKVDMDNSAVYLKGWSRKLQDNPEWLYEGAQAAQKAINYILEQAEVDVNKIAA